MAPKRLWVKPQEDLKLLRSTLRVSLEVECWGVDEKGSRRRSWASTQSHANIIAVDCGEV